MSGPDGQLLQITATDEGFLLTGEIDGHSSASLGRALADVADRHIAVDLSGVSFVDSSGLRVLIEAHQRAEAADGSLTFVALSPAVARLLELSGVSEYLRIKPEVADT